MFLSASRGKPNSIQPWGSSAYICKTVATVVARRTEETLQKSDIHAATQKIIEAQGGKQAGVWLHPVRKHPLEVHAVPSSPSDRTMSPIPFDRSDNELRGITQPGKSTMGVARRGYFGRRHHPGTAPPTPETAQRAWGRYLDHRRGRFPVRPLNLLFRDVDGPPGLATG